MSDALISITSEISDYLLIASAVAAILVTAAGVESNRARSRPLSIVI